MSGAAEAAIAAAAWLAAGALAVAAAAVAFGVKSLRRTRRAETRLIQLQTAVDDFCDALRARIALERRRVQGPQHGDDREAPDGEAEA
jgi:hypothetical protein